MRMSAERFCEIIIKTATALKKKGIRYVIRQIVKKYFIKNEYTKYVLRNNIMESNALFVNSGGDYPVISIVTPVFNTPKKYLREMIDSCLAQVYPYWELCLADASDKFHDYVGEIIRQYADLDYRIKYRKLSENKNIAENTNEAVRMTSGDYIALFDHDDVLHADALFEYYKVIKDKNADFIYCDEMTFVKKPGNVSVIHFKPDLSMDTLRSYNYICHFTVFRKSLLEKTGLFDSSYDGAQDYDMILKLIENSSTVVHIPRILYFWRGHNNSVAMNKNAKTYAVENGRKAVSDHLNRFHLDAKVESLPAVGFAYRVKYKLSGNPLVSIVIPSRDNAGMLSKCIFSIMQASTYSNIEIIIVENNSSKKETMDYYGSISSGNGIKVVYYDKTGDFNYSDVNNFGVKHANGDYILFLNDDIEVISGEWIQELLMFAQRPDVGAVGAKLYYPNDTLQHAGVVVGICGFAGHSHKHFEKENLGYFSRCVIQQNYSAVTGACLMVRKQVFNEVGGFDPEFAVALNDVDLCLRINKAGYHNVWTPFAELYHYESVTRGYEDTPEKKLRFVSEVDKFKKRWKEFLAAGDPCYNVNLSLEREDFSLKK